MRPATLIAALALLATPATGQQEASELAAAFGDVLRGCYRAAPDVEARQACIGQMAETCMNGTDGGWSTLGMTFCTLAEAEVWDEYLNAEYRQTRAWAEAADAEEAEFFPGYAQRAEFLLEAQRAWITFRDAECGLEYALWGSGSMRNIAGASCKLDMTAARTIELRSHREMFQ